MSEQAKIGWHILLPLILFAVTHLVIIGVTYGSLTNEMKNLTKSVNSVVMELKAINQHVYKLRESDITIKSQQDHNTKRIEKLEVHRP